MTNKKLIKFTITIIIKIIPLLKKRLKQN